MPRSILRVCDPDGAFFDLLGPSQEPKAGYQMAASPDRFLSRFFYAHASLPSAFFSLHTHRKGADFFEGTLHGVPFLD